MSHAVTVKTRFVVVSKGHDDDEYVNSFIGTYELTDDVLIVRAARTGVGEGEREVIYPRERVIRISVPNVTGSSQSSQSS